MIPHHVVVAIAVLAPAIAGTAWLALSRSSRARGVVGGLLAAAGHAAAWTVVVRLYRGETPSWRGLSPGLLEATVVALAEVGVILLVLRLERLPSGDATASVVAVAAGTSAVVAGAYADSFAVQAIMLPVPTLAAIASGLLVGRRGLAGAAGLAAADALGLVGLSMLLGGGESSLVGPASGPGAAMVLVAAAAKAGAFPGVATWRLTAAGLPGAAVTPVLRAQAMAMAAVAAIRVAGAPEHAPIAAALGVAALAGGLVAILTANARPVGAAVCGVGAAIPLVAVALGGAVGVRAFLLLAPAFLLAAAIIDALVPDEDTPAATDRWTWLAAPALAVAVASMAGLPPSGGFPGTWLTLSLGSARGEASPAWLLLVAPAAVALALIALGGVSLLRMVRPRAVPAVAALAGGSFLLYLGSVPVRLALGWLVRVERGLPLPELLPSAGAPDIPGITGAAIAVASIPAILVVGLLLGLGRGFRRTEAPTAPIVARGRFPRTTRLAERVRGRAVEMSVGVVTLSILELGVLVLVIRLILAAAGRGFL